MNDSKRELVLRVNELFHDLEGKEYENIHPEIFEQERSRWISIFDAFVPKHDTPKIFLDIGSGTGFVGSLLLPHLHAGDTLICADISDEMLQVAKENLKSKRSDVLFPLLKMQGETLDLEDQSVDCAMMNSVLHHIPDYETLLKEMERVLKPSGLLIIGHEPNALFFRNSFLCNQYTFLHRAAPKRVAASILRLLGLYNKVAAPKKDPLLDALNKKLLEEKLIDKPLSRLELSPLIDIHSPTAGSLQREKGFDPTQLLPPSFNTLSVETYNHLSKLSGKNAAARLYEKVLRFLFPKKGATFFLVAKKKYEARSKQ